MSVSTNWHKHTHAAESKAAGRQNQTGAISSAKAAQGWSRPRCLYVSQSSLCSNKTDLHVRTVCAIQSESRSRVSSGQLNWARQNKLARHKLILRQDCLEQTGELRFRIVEEEAVTSASTIAAVSPGGASSFLVPVGRTGSKIKLPKMSKSRC